MARLTAAGSMLTLEGQALHGSGNRRGPERIGWRARTFDGAGGIYRVRSSILSSALLLKEKGRSGFAYIRMLRRTVLLVRIELIDANDLVLHRGGWSDASSRACAKIM